MSNTASLDQTFQALSDGTRRAIVHALANGPASMSELAAPFDMALPSFAQHMSTLESAGLVRSEKQGRKRIYTLEPQSLDQVEHWLTAQRRMWTARLDQMDSYLLTLKGNVSHDKTKLL